MTTRIFNKNNLDSNIVWEGYCVCDKGKVYFEMPKHEKGYEACPKCNGTGTITRPATMEEIREGIDFAPGLSNGGILKIEAI